MKIRNLRRSDGPSEQRAAQLCLAMIEAFEGSPANCDDVMAAVVVFDVVGMHASVASTNMTDENREKALFAALKATLKGSGRTVQIIDDRPQG